MSPPEDSVSEPSRPEQLTVDFQELADGIVVTATPKGGPRFFLLLWMTGWTVGCVFLAGTVISQPSLFALLFAVPFWAAWLAVGSMLIWSFFGQETLVFREDRVLFLRKALITLSVREHPMSEVRRCRTCRSWHQENDQHLWGIEVETAGKPIRFGFRIPSRERLWLISQFNQFIGTQDDSEASTSSTGYAKQGAVQETQCLTLDDTLEEPPTDCSWELQERSDGVELGQQGQFRIGTFLGLLFVNCFWNGVVSVFVLGLFGMMPGDGGPSEGGEWWMLFVFLIPFEVVGLLMLACLLVVAVEPFRRTVWRLDHQEMVTQTVWPLFRFSWRWPADGIDRIDLRQQDPDRERSLKITVSRGVNPGLPDEGNYELTFVSDANTDQCSIGGLTEGEARWIAGVLLRCRPQWSG